MALPINRSGPFSPFSPHAGGTGTYLHDEQVSEAVVVDVIVNETHIEYAPDGYNVGAIKFRAIKTDQYRQDGQLNWAFPLESNITNYPLLNEIVHIIRSLNRFYYTRAVNVSQRITAQPMFGLNEELSPVESSADRTTSYTTQVTPQVDGTNPSTKLGSYYQDNDKTYRLRSDEGDVLIEGRSGHSIRFGTAWNSTSKTLFQGGTDQAPNLLFRVGQDPNAKPSVTGKFATVKEDVNKDATSLYMVSDQTVALDYATKNSSIQGKSIVDFPNKLDGNQLIINTDRFVVNTKKNKILGFSLLGIHWTTNNDFTVDADRDYVSQITRDKKLTIGHDWLSKIGNIYDATAGTRYSIVAPKVYVGLHQDDSQPIICGELMTEFLGKLLDAFITNAPSIIPFTSAPNTPSTLSPAVVSILQQLRQDVARGAKASFNSSIAFTVK